MAGVIKSYGQKSGKQIANKDRKMAQKSGMGGGMGMKKGYKKSKKSKKNPY